jgi:hypothetical protein
MQAEIDKLKQTIANDAKKVENAAGVQRAFNTLQAKDGDAAKYLLALSQGIDVQAPWEGKTSEAPIDPDLDTEGALKALEERLTAQFSQQMSQVTNLLGQQVTAATQRAMTLESKNAIDSTQQWFEQTYPAMDFETYRKKAAEIPGAEHLAGNAEGLKALLNAAAAPDLVEYGRTQVAEQKARANQAALDIFGGPTPTGAKGGDEDDFADLDDEFQTNPDGALQKAVERMSAHL